MSAKSILFHTFKDFPSNDLQAFIEIFNVMFVLLFSTYTILLLNLLRENAKGRSHNYKKRENFGHLPKKGLTPPPLPYRIS